MPYILEIVFYSYRLLMAVLLFFGAKKFLNGKNSGIVEKANAQEFIFVFPVYKEQSIIASTFEHYHVFLDKNPHIRLVFVGDPREVGEDSTINLVSKLAKLSKHSDRIDALVCTEEGMKSTKLNCVIRLFREQLKKAYLVSFDCDVRIDYSDFSRLSQLGSQENSKSKHKTLAWSFVPYTSMDHTSPLIKAALLSHYERMICWEVGNYALPVFLCYPMGATMVLSPEVWKYIHALPEPIEDIPLGFYLSQFGIRCSSLPYFSKVLPPKNFLQMSRQHIPIFTGVFSIHLLKKVNALDPVLVLLCYILFVSEFVALGYAVYATVSGNFLPIGLLSLQILIQLLVLGSFNIANFLLSFVGYFLRFVYFVRFLAYGIIPGNIKLKDFKTERQV